MASTSKGLPTSGDQLSKYNTDIFIPNHFFECLPCLTLCAVFKNDLNYKINALYIVHDQGLLPELVSSATKVFPSEFSVCIGLLGDENLPNITKKNFRNFSIVISDTGGFHVKNLNLHEDCNAAKHSVTLVTYASHEILDCESQEQESNVIGSSEKMIHFLNHTFAVTKKLNNEPVVSNHTESIIPCVASSVSPLKLVLVSILLLLLKPLQSVTSPNLYKMFRITATGRQVSRKLSNLKELYQYLQSREISLKCGNLLAAVITDVVLGILVTFILQDYLNPEKVFASILETTEWVVNELQTLLKWLMGAPAGLKLNRPLNIVLGRFFLYHIYLWKTYIVVLKPFLLIALENSTYFGILGLSFLFSFASDFISLATIHIYCFYGYAARLYNLNVTGLIALWRLFCGKKWNPLRNRVDSYTYDVQQLFIGTLMFTVLIFLLPTVIVYYTVFTLLRLTVLCFLLTIESVVKLVNTAPIYVIFLRLIGHSYVRGDIYFQVLMNTEDTVHLYLEPKPSSWTTLLSKTRPNVMDQSNMTWMQLVFSLLRGQIIYPL